MEAQIPSATIAGEYYMRVPETACGFKLNEDSSFQFFFSQGALDRSGEGSWKVKDNKVVFNSRKRPAQDFALLQSKQIAGDKISIQVADQNEMLLRYVYVTIKGEGKIQQSFTNEKGAVSFEPQQVDSIELVFEFCPEKISVFTFSTKPQNYFVFRFEPWLFELFFEQFSLDLEADGLKGANPILSGESFLYRKAGTAKD